MQSTHAVDTASLPRTGNITRGPVRYDYYEHVVLQPQETVAYTSHVGTRVVPGGINVALVGLQLIVGYDWLVSGIDKLLDGTFPDKLSGITVSMLGSDHLPVYFSQFLSNVVVPNGQLFGYAVELGETLAGLGLLLGAMLGVLIPQLGTRLTGSTFLRRMLSILSLLVAGAALATITMGINYFLMDGLPLPWFTPGLAVGGALDTGLFLALAGIVILAGQLASLSRVWQRAH